MTGGGGDVRVADDWIVLSDGCRLSARLWLPAHTEEPVPALFEYIPYRKGDRTAPRDAARHPYFAHHGYASIRVDIRGSGDSDGVLRDEYLPQEQEDALEVVRWIAAHEWCSGDVGMFGLSWGGFSSLQVAARRPPELKAIITVCSTDDRYAEDVHYSGGCVMGADMPAWAATVFAYNARPPDPASVGERWREMWLERLEENRPFIEAWLAHQRRDEFWQHGSVCEDYSAIEAAVYAVGGWADPYRSAVLRLLGGLPGPRKGLIGPWPHQYPDQVHTLGPAIDFLAESRRWWDFWLKGEDTGIMDEPMLRVWMQESVEPRPSYRTRPGRWVAEEAWPSPQIAERRLVLNEGTLDQEPSAPSRLSIRGRQATGIDAGRFMAIGNPSDLPPDQRVEDGLSLSFTSAPLPERLEILGVPEIVLRLTCDRPLALVAVRLCDVAPAGASTLVTRGLLNLTHRESHERPEPLETGRWYAVRVRLSAIAHAFAGGNRIRVAVSPTYWPWAWPSPEVATLTIKTGAASWLELPVRPPRPEDDALAPFPTADRPASGIEAADGTGEGERVIHRDVAGGRVELVVDPGYLRRRLVLPDGLEYEERAVERCRILEDDPLSAEVDCRWTIEIARGDWRTRVETASRMTADAAVFKLENTSRAFEGGEPVFSKIWTAEIPRDLV